MLSRHLSCFASGLLCLLVAVFVLLPSAARADLVSAWEFNAEDVTGTTVALSGGTLAGLTGSLEANANVTAGTLSLDGDGDYLAFGNDVTELRTLSKMTIASWVNWASEPTGRTRILEHEDNIYFWAEGGKYQFTIHGTPGGVDGRALSTTAPAIDEWQHVLVTYEAGKQAQIYINGVLEGTSVSSQALMPNNTQTLQIGARRNGSGDPSDFLHGQMDDVAIWDQILTQDNIEELAGESTGGGYLARTVPTALTLDPVEPEPPKPSYATLVGWWKLDEGAGLAAADSSPMPVGGSPNGGTLQGGPEWDGGLSGANDVKVPYGLRFAGDGGGADDEVDLDAHLTDLNTLAAGTMSAWFRKDQGLGSDDMSIFGFGQPDSNDFFRIQLENGNQVRFDQSNGGQAWSGTSTLTDDGNWHHVAVTSDGSGDANSANVYLDGVLVAAGDTKWFDSFMAGTAQLGSLHRGGVPQQWEFEGTLADVRIYDKPLNSDEIQYLGDMANFGDGRKEAASGATLVAQYTMDNDAVNGDVIQDTAGFVLGPFDGTKANGGPTTGVPGVVGEAAEFAGGANNGDNQFIDVSAHAAALHTLTEGTLSAFIKPDNEGLTTDVLTIFSASDVNAGSVEVRWFVSDTGNLVYGVRGSDMNGTVTSSGVDLLDGEWHHVAVSVGEENAVTLFVDGDVVGEGLASFLGGLSELNGAAIGRNKDSAAGGGQWFYDGLIDDVRVYDKALTHDEIVGLATIPEPSSLILLAIGLLGLAAYRRRHA